MNPVIAAGGLVDVRSTAEVAHHDDQHFVNQSAAIETFPQGRERSVHDRQVFLEDLKIPFMSVPANILKKRPTAG